MWKESPFQSSRPLDLLCSPNLRLHFGNQSIRRHSGKLHRLQEPFLGHEFADRRRGRLGIPGDRLRDGDLHAGLGQLGDLREDVEVVLDGLRRVEAGVDAGEAALGMPACNV